MALLKALASGAVGATALTIVHETVRRLVPNAPRVDVLGMRAIARPMRELGQEPPPRDTLFYLALVGDLVSNSLYYSLIGLGSRKDVWRRGAALGLTAGVAGVLLPGPLGLGHQPGQRFPATQVMTVAWYLIGGLAAAAAAQRIKV